MAPEIDRRAALAAMSAATLAGASGPAFARALTELQSPMSATMPNTRYFEVDSVRVGARFGVWVTTPPLYDRSPGQTYPVVFQPDGNGSAPLIAARMPLLPSDPINPIRPFVSVCVGYTGADAKRHLAVRARDLLPPGEPLPDGLEAGIADVVKSGFLDREGGDLYIKYLRNPAADRFLAFLSEELHPLIARSYRINDEVGLFGYSYGGLFAAYVALTPAPLLRFVGAGSAGILPRRSTIFAMYRAALEKGVDFKSRAFHMVLNEFELTRPSYYAPMVAAGSTELMALLAQPPPKGMRFSSHFVPYESHATGNGAALFSYLRTCLGAKPA